MDHLDEYVERIVVAFLSREDVAEAVHQHSEDAEVAHAHAEVERLGADLEEARALASTGQLKPVDFVRIESGLSAQIATWEAKAAQAGLPPVLRGWFGPHAEADWLALKDNVAVKREIIRAVLAIELGRTPRFASRNFTTERVGLRWLIGPDADTTQKVRPRTLLRTAAQRAPMTTTVA